MARPSRRLALAIAVTSLVVLVPLAAQAQGLRKLHVDALSMRADRTQLQLGEVFHLAIHVHVRERIAALDELVVPDVGTMLLEGDERHVTSSNAGTEITETLTLEPTAAGAFTFNGAYVDAIDARTGRPSRFSANPLRVVVAGSAGTSKWLAVGPLEIIVALAIASTAIAVLVGFPIAILVLARRAARPVAVTVPQPASAQERTPRDDVAAALMRYRNARDGASLLQLRGTLFAAAGVPAGATLRDALSASTDAALQRALAVAERAAFGPQLLRERASDELIEATEGWLR